MLTFNNDQKLKDEYLHIIIYEPVMMELKLGIPLWLGELYDYMAEVLLMGNIMYKKLDPDIPTNEKKAYALTNKFRIDFIQSIPVGINLYQDVPSDYHCKFDKFRDYIKDVLIYGVRFHRVNPIDIANDLLEELKTLK